jgi:Tfp pilus assembly protein PilZ
MPKKDEKRSRVRVPLKSRVRHSEYQVLGTPVFLENAAIDLSSGGISFEASREYRVGSLVILEFELNGEKLKLLVCVAWVKKVAKDRFQVGAEVMAMDPGEKERLRSHLGGMIESLGKASRSGTRKKKSVKKKTSKKKTAKKKPSVRKKQTRKPQSRKMK